MFGDYLEKCKTCSFVRQRWDTSYSNVRCWECRNNENSEHLNYIPNEEVRIERKSW